MDLAELENLIRVREREKEQNLKFIDVFAQKGRYCQCRERCLSSLEAH
jgi:hypothetical protein